MKAITLLLGCAALLMVGATAQAQVDEQALARDWTVRAGFFVPERQAARDAQGDIWFTAGVERTVWSAEDRYEVTFSLDYYGSGNLYNIPIGLNVRGVTHRLRYGAGLGLGVSHSFDGGKTGLAYNLLVGTNLTPGDNPITFDVRYMGLTTGENALNGWAFTVGRRF